MTEDGKTKVKSPSATLSTAEAIAVVNQGLALASYFGKGSIGPRDVAAGLVGAIVRDPVQDSRDLARVPRDRDEEPLRLERPVQGLPRGQRVTVTVLGIRHHGPGSARSVRDELRRLAPDVVLIEGPPEANDVLAAVGEAGLKPPVALLVYATERPEAAGFYPFAEFSPEWQAIRYANEAGVPVRCIDLAAGLQRGVRERLATDEAEEPVTLPDPLPVPVPPTPEPASDVEPAVDPAAIEELDEETLAALLRRLDPMSALAEITGDADGERFWDRLVESRGGHAAEAFAAITEAMAALRERTEIDEETLLREAAMRREIRAAVKSGAQNIVVVCGAWHAPALLDLKGATADDKALKALGKPPKMTATWVPVDVRPPRRRERVRRRDPRRPAGTSTCGRPRRTSPRRSSPRRAARSARPTCS